MASRPAIDVLTQAARPNARIRYRDLSVQDPALKAKLMAAFDRILTSGQILMGPEVERFEQRVADYCGRRHCVGLSSGSNAIYLALKALGLSPGDEIITTPMSWIATLNTIHLAGATPVFVDVADDMNIDTGLIEDAITPRTKAILPVHFNGKLCDMAAIGSIAKRHGLAVIEDAAQAFGARDAQGVPAGGFGHAAAFSLNPMKVLPGYGEAGAVVTDDPEVAERLRALRYLGTVDKEVCEVPALNDKIDELQAALLLVGFDDLEANIDLRIGLARLYSQAFAGSLPCPPVATDGDRSHVFFDYKVLVERRDEIQQSLLERGIETKVKHPILMPDQPAYRHLPRPEIPNARRLVDRILSLPLHEKLTAEDVETVVQALRDALDAGGQRA